MTQERTPGAGQQAPEEARASGRRETTTRRSRRSHSHLPYVLAGVVAMAGVGAAGVAVYKWGENNGSHVAYATSTPSLEPTVVIPSPTGEVVVTFPPTDAPTTAPTEAPTTAPTVVPTEVPTEAPTTAPSEAPTTAPSEQPSAPVEGAVSVPATLSEIPVRALTGGAVDLDGNLYEEFTPAQWFNPLYDQFQVQPSADNGGNWRGIGPWYPVEYRNLDENAAILSTHGNVGELIVEADKGGWVEVGFWQLDNYQDDGAWGRGPDGVGPIYHDGSWAMQYTFKELGANAEVQLWDPDTNMPLLWPDGSPVIFQANDKGTAAFEIPQTNGNDVRVAFRFRMPSSDNGTQPHEVKIEHGPNDRPGRTGENHLPDSVLKSEVPLN